MLKLPGCHPWKGALSVWLGCYKGLEETGPPERSGIQEMGIRHRGRRGVWLRSSSSASEGVGGPILAGSGPSGPENRDFWEPCPTLPCAVVPARGRRGPAPILCVRAGQSHRAGRIPQGHAITLEAFVSTCMCVCVRACVHTRLDIGV